MLAAAPITPVIEPVRSNFSGLNRALSELAAAGAEFILVINPKSGDLADSGIDDFREILNSLPDGFENYSLGYIIDEECSPDDVAQVVNDAGERGLSFIHW